MRAVRWSLGLIGDLCLTVGALLLLFVVWQLWWTDVTAGRAQAATVHELSRDFAASDPAPGPSTPRPTTAPATVPEPAVGKAFAVLRVPRFGADWVRPVIEGTGHDVLQRGVGHYRGTAMPGAVGNFAIAGHRTTWGRPFHDIDRLRAGDLVVVETRSAYSVYAVRSHLVVDPTDVQVITPVPNRPGARATSGWLTMTACHPKYSAAHRYVVFAQLVHTYTHGAGLPPGTLTAPKAA
jgi:sortase A